MIYKQSKFRISEIPALLKTGWKVETELGNGFALMYREYTDEQLRQLREEQCFKVVNRGKLWYDKLTPQQIEELNIWYANWLDVTTTKQAPQEPSWLKEV